MRKTTWLLLFCLSLGNAALADVPDDKDARIEEYRLKAVDLVEDKGRYDLKIGDSTIGDEELARLADDTEALADLRNQFWLRKTYQFGLGTLSVPLGSFLLYDNLYGKREKQDFAPPSRLAPYPPGSFGAYLLALGGGLLASYGGYLLTQWGSEILGFSQPNLLEAKEAKRLQKRCNRRLREEFMLTLSDVASLSATASLANGENGGFDLIVPAGEEGTAAFSLRRALKSLESQRGKNFRVFAISGSLKDYSGKMEEGGWQYFFYHPEKPERIKVTVPKFGEPEINVSNDFEAYPRLNGQPTQLVRTWKIDSPKAMEALKSEFFRRGLSAHEDFSITLYPYFEDYPQAVWIAEAKKIRLAVDAKSGKMVETLNRPQLPQP
jgi:hypothetical protein